MREKALQSVSPWRAPYQTSNSGPTTLERRPCIVIMTSNANNGFTFVPPKPPQVMAADANEEEDEGERHSPRMEVIYEVDEQLEDDGWWRRWTEYSREAAECAAGQ